MIYDYGKRQRHPDDLGPELCDLIDADTGEELTGVTTIDTDAGTVTRLVRDEAGRLVLNDDRTAVVVQVEKRRIAFRAKADVPVVVTKEPCAV